jgi:hypothetical protein
VSGFDAYRDPETRREMLTYVASSCGIDPATAERELRQLNHVGLAYVYRDMVEAQQRAQRAIADYDPLPLR